MEFKNRISYKRKNSKYNVSIYARLLSIFLSFSILFSSVQLPISYAVETSYENVASPSEAFSINSIENRGIREGDGTPEEFEDALEEGGFKYVIRNDEAMIVGLADDNTETTITIPNEIGTKAVTSIASHAFYFKNLSAVILNENLKNIGDYAFTGNNIESIEFPNSVKHIGASAFRDNLLTEVNLNNINNVLEEAFANNKLATLLLGTQVESLGDSAFANNKLTEITIPDTLTNVGEDVFSFNGRFVNVKSTAEPLNIPAIQKTEGGYGYVINPIIVKVTYINDETGLKLLDDKVLGDDFTSVKDIFAKGSEQIYEPPVLDGYEPILEEGKKGVSFTPDANPYNLEVRYRKKTSGLVLKQNTQNRLMIPVGANNVEELLRDLIIATNNAGDDLKDRVTIEPESIDTSVEGTIHEVNYTLKDDLGEVKRLKLSVYVGTDMNNYPLGNDWVLGDFVYGGSTSASGYDSDPTHVIGFSEQGLKKVQTNKELILPHINPVTGDVITVVNSYSKDNYKYSFRGKNLTSVRDFDKNIVEIGYYDVFRDNKLTEVSLPNLEKVGTRAFYNNTTLVDFDFSKIKSVEYESFRYTGIKKLDAPNLVTINAWAFADSQIGSDPDFLQGIYLPLIENENIKERAFYNTKLTYLDQETQFPRLTVLPTYVFSYAKIQRANLPTVTSLGYGAIHNQTNPEKLTSIYAPNLEVLEAYALSSNGLTEIDFPKLHTIKYNAMEYNKLTNINIPKVITIESAAFYRNKLEGRLELPVTTSVGSSAFYENKIEELVAPVLESVGDSAFYNNLLTSLNLPALTTIGNESFRRNKIKEANLPITRSIGYGAFDNNDDKTYNPGLEAYGGLIPIYTDNNDLESKENYVINPEDGQAGEYTDDDFTWDPNQEGRVTGFTTKGKLKFVSNDFKLKFTPKAKVIARHAFRWENIKEVIGPAVHTIEDYAFHRNPLEKVDFPEVETIGTYAFSNNPKNSEYKFAELNIPKAKNIGGSAFYYAGLSGVLNLDSVEVLSGSYNFAYNNITELRAPLLTEIRDSYAFYSNKIKELKTPELKNIGYYAFGYNNISELNKKVLPKIEKIEGYAFGYNPLLGVIDLPTLKKLAGNYEFTSSTIDPYNPLVMILGDAIEPPSNKDWISNNTFGNFAYIESRLYNWFKAAPAAIILTAKPNADGTLDRTNPKGITDKWHSAREWNGTKYVDNVRARKSIVNPSTVKVNYRLESGEALDGLDGRPKKDDFREYIYAELFEKDRETGALKTVKPYVAPQIAGYTLVSSTDTDGNTVAKRAKIDVPFEKDGQKLDQEITFTYKKLDMSNIAGPKLVYGVAGSGNDIEGQDKEYVSTSPSTSSQMPQMLTSFFIEEVKKVIKKGKIKITFDSPYIDPNSITLATSDATRNWYLDDAMVVSDTGLEITLNENISAGSALRGARIAYRYKSGGRTPDQTTTRMSMILVDEDDAGNEEVIAVAEPVDLTLVYKPTPTITVNSPLNIRGYNYSGYSASSGGPRNLGDLENTSNGYKVVDDPSYTRFYYTTENVYYLMDQAELTTELPKYTALNEAGVEEERTAIFDPTTNPDWTLDPDGITLRTTKNFRPTRDKDVINRYLPELRLKFPNIKEKTNVVNKAYLKLRPYRDPRDTKENSNVVATGDLGVGDSLTIYPLYTIPPKPFVAGDRTAGKHHGGTPRSLNGTAYLYDNLEDKEKDITFKLYVSSTNEIEDYKNVSIIDYDLDSRLVYKQLRFDQTPEQAGNMNVLVIGYKKVGDKINPSADRVVFEKESQIDKTKYISFSDDPMDYIQIKLLGTDVEPLSKSLSFTVVTKVKDPSQNIFSNEEGTSSNIMINRAMFIGDTYKKGTDIATSKKATNPEFEFIEANNVFKSQASVNILEYKVNVKVDKSLVAFDTGKIDSYKRYPSIESGEIVLEGEKGAYHIMLNSSVEGNPSDRGNEILKNLEIIDVLPEAIETQLSDIELDPSFIKAKGKVQIIDNYQTIENGEQVTRRAIRFYSDSFDMRVYGNKPLYVATIKTKYTGNTIKGVLTNKVYASWDNKTVAAVSPATTNDKSNFINPHGANIAETDKLWSYDEVSIKVSSSSALTGRLYIRNRRDMIWQDSTFTASNEPFDYKLVVSNFDNREDSSPYEAIDIVNIIPGIDDYKLNKQGARGTEFENTVDVSRIATDLVLPQGYDITYYNTDKSIHDILHGRSVDELISDPSVTWSSTPAANTKVFRITARPGVVLAKGDKIEIEFPMRAPTLSGIEDPMIGKRAVDSFSLRHFENGRRDVYTRHAEVNNVYNYMEGPTATIKLTKFGKLGNLASDDTAYPLEGAGFELLDRNTNEVVAASYSNGTGIVEFRDVATNREYKIREFLTPETYVASRNNEWLITKRVFIDNTANGFNIVLSETDSKNKFMNVKAIRGKIKIIKKTRDDIQTIPNISFRVRGLDFTNNTFDKEFTTGEDGTITIENLEEGRYEISEIESSAINRYQKAPNQTVRIDANTQEIESTFVNDKFQVLFRKIIVDNETVMDPSNWDQLTDFGRKKVSGYRFRVVGEDGTTFTTSTTNTNGTVILQNLKTDVVYTVTELTPDQLSGNLKNLYTHNDREYKFKITHDGKLLNALNNKKFKQYALNIPNMPKVIKGKISVKKTDETTPANVLAGARIELSKIDFDTAGEISGLTSIGIKETNDLGMVEFDELEAGTYQIKEVLPPNGYLLNTETIEVTIPSKVLDAMATDNNYDKSGDSIKFSTSRTIKDKKSSVKLIKGNDIEGYKNISLEEANKYIQANAQTMPNLTYRSVGKNLYTVYNPLENVVFELYKMQDGQKVEPAIQINGSSDLLTDANGNLNFGDYKFEYDTEYALIEKASIEGYVKYDGIKTFKFSEEDKKANFKGEVSFYINNVKEEGSILVSKYDGFNRRSLEGASFEIFAGTLQTADFNSPLREITTAYNGYALFDKLPFGTYVIREKQAPSGYREPTADERDKEVVISRDRQDARLIIFNKKTIDISITKNWAESSEANAKFKLLRSVNKNTGFVPVVVPNFTDDTGVVTATATSDENTNWKVVYEDLDRSDETGKRYYYKVEEVDVPKNLYTTTISGTEENGFVVTNTDKPENKVSISVTKAWDLPLGIQIPENASIVAVLEKVNDADTVANILESTNVTEVERVTLNEANNWQHTFTNLKRKENGKDIVYRVVEKNLVNGFESTTEYENNNFTITNKAIRREKIKVTKNWLQVNNDAVLPRISVELYDKALLDENPLATPIASAEVIKKDTGEYVAEFNDIPSYAYYLDESSVLQSRKIQYVIKEKYLDGKEHVGYSSSDDMNDEKFAVYSTDDNISSNIEATITNLRATQDIKVVKEWSGVEFDNAPEVELKVYDATDDETDDLSNTSSHIEVGSVVLNKDNNFTKSLSDLPRYKEDGIREIRYILKEINKNKGYTFSFTSNRIDETNLTLTARNEKITRNLSITKQWSEVPALFTGEEFVKPRVRVHIYADKTGSDNYVVNQADEIANSPMEVVAGDDNSYTLTINNLDKYTDDGVTEIKYYVVEEAITGYSSNATEANPKLLSVLSDGDDTLKATIINTRERVNIQAIKTWEGLEAYSEDIRDNTPTVHIDLYVKTENTDERLVDGRVARLVRKANSDSNVWEANFTNLPKYDEQGNKLIYALKEREASLLNGYISNISELPDDLAENNVVNITNTVRLKKLKVKKSWLGKDKDAINIILKKNNEKISDIVLTSASVVDGEAWSHKIENLPYYEIDGVTEISYTFEEEALNDYKSTIITSSVEVEAGRPEVNEEYTFINLYKTVDINISKTWENVNIDDAPEIRLQLTDNTNNENTPIANKIVTLNRTNNFRAVIEDMPLKKEDGTTIVYGVIELDDLAGYDFTFDVEYDESETDASPFGIYNIVANNTLVKQKAKLTKTFTQDKYNYARPEVTFKLWADKTNDNVENPDTFINTYTLNSSNNYAVEIDDLDKYLPDGKTLIKYYVSEDEVAGYTSVKDKVLLTLEDDVLKANLENSLKLRNISVKKTWQGLDVYKQDAIDNIPEINVKLYDKTDANNKRELASKVLVKENDEWKAEFEALPVYKEDGITKIVYDIEEVEANTLPGYTSDIVSNFATEAEGNLEFNITNTVKTLDITLNKTWYGVDKTLAPEIRLQLIDKAKTTDVDLSNKEVVLNNAKNWTETIASMPLYHIDGVTKVDYGVTEDELAGYEFAYELERTQDGRQIIVNAKNKRKLIDIILRKTWADDLSSYERPEVTYKLWKNEIDNNPDTAVETKAIKRVVNVVENNEIEDFVEVDSIKLNKENQFTVSYKVPKYAPNGETIVNYFVTEEAINGYVPNNNKVALTLEGENLTASIENSLIVRDVIVEKDWQGLEVYKDSSLDSLPEVQVELYDVTDADKAIKVRETETLVKNPTTSKWETKFVDLPKFKQDGITEIIYKVKELGTDELLGYDVAYATPVVNAVSDAITLGITNTVKTIDVRAVKKWVGVDLNNAPTIILQLIDNTKNIKDVNLENKELVLSVDNKFMNSFGKLPIYQIDGKTEIDYKLVEKTRLNGYIFSDIRVRNDIEILLTGTNTRVLRNISLHKTYTDDLSSYERPEVTFRLFMNRAGVKEEVSLRPDGTEIGEIKLSSSNNWQVNINGLAKYAEDGVTEIEYFVREERVAGYRETEEVALSLNEDNILSGGIENTLLEKSVIVNKVWSGLDLYSEKERENISEIYVQLLDNTDPDNIIKVREPKKLKKSDDGTWSVRFDRLPIYKQDGTTYISYTVEEVDIQKLPGYEAKVDIISGVGEEKDLNIRLTNTIKTVPVSIKKEWVGVKLATPPDAVFAIENDSNVNVENLSLRLNDNNNWEDVIANLPLYKADGKTKVNYTVRELETHKGYELSQNTEYLSDKILVTAINTRVTRPIKLNKIWLEDKSKYERPEVKLSLYRNIDGSDKEKVSFEFNGETVDEIKLSKENNWEFKLSGFDKYDVTGDNEYTYFVREDKIDAYITPSDDIRLDLSTDEALRAEDTLVAEVENKLILRDVKVIKEWVGLEAYDDENIISKLPDVSAVLYDATDESKLIFLDKKLINRNDTNIWTAEFNDLPKFKEDGKTEIKYIVKEFEAENNELLGYITSYEEGGIDSDDNIQAKIINKLRPRNIVINKSWIGQETEDIEVYLEINGVDEEKTKVKITPNTDKVWTYTYQGLPYFEVDGKTVRKYLVKEVEIPGYSLEVKSLEIPVSADETFKDLGFEMLNAYVNIPNPKGSGGIVNKSNKPKDGPGVKNTEENNQTDKVDEKENSLLPKTGDYNNIILYVLMLLFSIVGFIYLFFSRKSYKSKK